MSKKVTNPDDHLDQQHKEVLLRDAKHFYKLDKILDILKVETLYDLRLLPISELKESLNDKQITEIINALDKWHCSPANWREPKNITYYDNTGKSYWVNEHHYKVYHEHQ